MTRLLLLMFCSLAAPRAVLASGILEVASWNLHNYLVHNRYEEGRFLFNYPMPEIRKQRIRQLILDESPDVIFLQELGGADFLFELQLDLAASGLVYPFYQYAGFAGARSGLAYLSRIPPAEVIFHDLPLRRGMQEVKLVWGQQVFRFFHVHLKSRFSDDPGDPDAHHLRREEFNSLNKALKILLRRHISSRCYIVGDFNTPFSDPLLSPLKASWTPLQLSDSTGDPNTYFHRSGSAEILDGFWARIDQPNPSFSGDVLPDPNDCPSDHRFVILRLPHPS